MARCSSVKGDHALVSAELYDPAAGTWVPIANMHRSYNGVTAMLLPDGMVLVAGGTFDGDLSAQLYDTATGAWTAVGPMAAVGGSATLLSDGRVLVSGRDGSELYDPASGPGSTTGTMSRQHDGAPATLLLDGTVLVAGGATDTAELYVPAGVSPP